MIPDVAGTISNVTGLPITVGNVKILRSYFDKLSIVGQSYKLYRGYHIRVYYLVEPH